LTTANVSALLGTVDGSTRSNSNRARVPSLQLISNAIDAIPPFANRKRGVTLSAFGNMPRQPRRKIGQPGITIHSNGTLARIPNDLLKTPSGLARPGLEPPSEPKRFTSRSASPADAL
jgi:hypothetical protein